MNIDSDTGLAPLENFLFQTKMVPHQPWFNDYFMELIVESNWTVVASAFLSKKYYGQKYQHRIKYVD